MNDLVEALPGIALLIFLVVIAADLIVKAAPTLIFIIIGMAIGYLIGKSV